MSLAQQTWDAAARREAWIAKQLESAPPLTQEQERNLRRLFAGVTRKKTA